MEFEARDFSDGMWINLNRKEVVYISFKRQSKVMRIGGERNWNTTGRLIVFGGELGGRQKDKMIERAKQAGFILNRSLISDRGCR
ncbi:unnamed protein product [Prunus armeniaca]|uniref:Uncharacterized protein n=1 Tax=Prunus armeniaca TaxID=36596 RepID=A0A6J5VJI1_PRUAR|nr:unnamed protein product [Prunus armeniaca]CAB4319489.1 unnamed protein product [Prunus armeniaca]